MKICRAWMVTVMVVTAGLLTGVAPTYALVSLTCTVTVPAGGDIQAAINGHAGGSTICLTAGKAYHIPSTLSLISGTDSAHPEILATNSTKFATIGCGSLPWDPSAPGPTTNCVNLGGTSFAQLVQLNVQNAPQHVVSLGTSSVLNDVTVTCGGDIGVVANGGAGAVDAVVKNGSTISNSPASENSAGCTSRPSTFPSCATLGSIFHPGQNPDGFCGGLKSNGSTGLTVQGSTFTGNGGGAGLWFDVNSHGSVANPQFKVTNNTVTGNTGAGGTDGIRIEVSCSGLLTANTVNTNSGTQIDIFNSNAITVGGTGTAANIVKTASQDGIRLIGSGRTDDNTHVCVNLNDSAGGGLFYYHNENNTVVNNTITVETGGGDGMVDTSGLTPHNGFGAGVTFNDLFMGNDYTLTGTQTCTGTTAWKLANAPMITANKVNWTDWRNPSIGNQDNTGTPHCTP